METSFVNGGDIFSLEKAKLETKAIQVCRQK